MNAALGFLLRKLPPKITVKKKQYGLVLTDSTTDGSWIVDYIMFNWQQPLPEHGLEVWLHYGDKAKLTEAMEVEDAAAKLCIELFKQNILTESAA